VLGLKAFLCHSGIEEFPNVTESELRAAMPVIARRGLPLLVHAELSSPLSAGGEGVQTADARSYRSYLASRPRAWEHAALRLMIGLGREYGCPVHIVHLSAADALPRFRAEGITFETCPHYLFFAAEEIPDGDPRFKCAPPIRERENREQLWQHVRAGLIDTIGSDHSPAPPELKELASGDLKRAWGGIASLQFGLPIIWTSGRVDLESIARLMCSGPASIAGIAKGKIESGYDADFVVWSPEESFRVTPEIVQHRHKVTPYAGEELRGVVKATYLRGRKVWEDGRAIGKPSGQWIRKN